MTWTTRGHKSSVADTALWPRPARRLSGITESDRMTLTGGVHAKFTYNQKFKVWNAVYYKK